MTFQMVSKVIGNIIQTIQQTAVVSVRALKAHTYSTKVTNFPEPLSSIKVNNLDEVSKEVRNTGKTLGLIHTLIKNFKLPKEIKVTNFPEFPKFPKYPTQINVGNFPKFPAFPTELKVSNPPDLKPTNEALAHIEKAISKLRLDPQISVPAPEHIIVPAPSVSVTQKEVDSDKLAKALAEVMPKIDYKKLAEAIAEEIGSMVVTSSGSGGGGGSSKPSFRGVEGGPDQALINRLRQVMTVNEDRWGLNNSFKSGNNTYTGEEDVDGNWIVRKINKNGNLITMSYATRKNNDTYTEYQAAWDDRLTLTYGRYQEAAEQG